MIARVISPAVFELAKSTAAFVKVGHVILRSRLPKSGDDQRAINEAVNLLVSRFNAAS